VPNAGDGHRINRWQAVAAMMAAIAALIGATIGVLTYVGNGSSTAVEARQSDSSHPTSSPTTQGPEASFDGTWLATERDRPGGGTSSLKLTISTTGATRNVILDDDYAGGQGCHGEPLHLAGTGEVVQGALEVAFTFTCEDGTTQSADVTFRLGSNANTLHDSSGTHWVRE
jgi:hypothetical protein